MPPKMAVASTSDAESRVRRTCDQCGESCIPSPYHTSTGKVIYCCDVCFAYGTDDSYVQSDAESDDDCDDDDCTDDDCTDDDCTDD